MKKPELVELYGASAEDPYMHNLHLLIERFCDDLGGELDAGFISAEKRGSSLDYDLLQAWERIRVRGTASMPAEQIDCRIVGLDLRDKRGNHAGLQLADLVVTPIGRRVLETAPKPNRVQWTTVEGKLRRVGTSYAGYGLVIRP